MLNGFYWTKDVRHGFLILKSKVYFTKDETGPWTLGKREFLEDNICEDDLLVIPKEFL